MNRSSSNEPVGCIDERSACDDDINSLSLQSVNSLTEVNNGYMSGGDEDDDLTIVSKSSKDNCRKSSISCHVKTEMESSNINMAKTKDNETTIEPFVKFSTNNPATVSDSSFTDESNKDYSDQPFEDVSSLSHIENSNGKVISAAATTSNKTESIRDQLLETRNGTKSSNMGAINRRGSDCASINRSSANRQKYYKLEYSRRHSTCSYFDADAASSHFTAYDADDNSLSSKSSISYKTDTSNRLRAIPARRIERIRSNLQSAPSNSFPKKEIGRSSAVPSETPFSDIANQYLF